MFIVNLHVPFSQGKTPCSLSNECLCSTMRCCIHSPDVEPVPNQLPSRVPQRTFCYLINYSCATAFIALMWSQCRTSCPAACPKDPLPPGPKATAIVRDAWQVGKRTSVSTHMKRTSVSTHMNAVMHRHADKPIQFVRNQPCPAMLSCPAI